MISINREKVLNAINPEILIELLNIFDYFKDKEFVRSIVITGSGNKAFDRSALAAIEKVGRFDNLDMRRKLFDQHFRNFTLVFSPRD